MSDEFILDDSYDVTPDQQSGLCGAFPRDFSAVPVGSLPFAAEATFTPIPRSEWPDRIRQQEKDKSRLSDLVKDAGIKCFNQGQTSYCHGNVAAMLVQILRLTQGEPFELLSPASVAGPITNFRNEGAYIEKDLEQIVNVGVASQKFVPPNQIGKADFKPGWEADANKRRVTEWWDFRPGDFDRMATLLLSGVPCGPAYNWWGHTVVALDLVMFGEGTDGFPKNWDFGNRDLNSWGENDPQPGAGGYFLLRELSRTRPARPDACYAPRTVTVSA